MADPTDSLAEQGLRVGERWVALDACLASHCPDRDAAVALRQVRKLGDAVQVDQQSRPSQTEVQEWHQALAAGEHFRLDAALREGRDRLVDRCGSDVIERWWLHVARTRERRQDTPPALHVILREVRPKDDMHTTTPPNV